MGFGICEGVIDAAATIASNENAYLAPVTGVRAPFDQSGIRHPGDNFGHRGLALKGAGGELADGHSIPVAQAREDAPLCHLKAMGLQSLMELRADL